MRKLDRFCHKYERFGIRNLIAIIMFGNAAVFFTTLLQLPILPFLWFDPELVLQGQVWRLITFVFIPDSLDFWFVFFMLFYFWIGRMLENQWGRMKFTLFYASGMLFTVLYGFLVFFLTKMPVRFTASDLNLTLFLAAATLFPDMQIRLYFFIPVKMKWLAIVYAALTLLPIFFPPYSLLSLMPLVSFGNYVLFFHPHIASFFRGLSKRMKRGGRGGPFKPRMRVVHSRPADQGDNAAGRGYRHKCAECGATDLSAPELEFRYCSLCKGTKCYCSRHIFEHEHT